jgi:hypothetical protein
MDIACRVAADWQRDRAHIESTPPAFGMAIERAADDLLALRNWEHDAAPDAWVPNAGLPTYTCLFGRDALTAGWQSALLGPEIMRGAIARLAATQADADSAWHDAEPGKMIHEMRRGPLSELDLIPQRGYYGKQTASSFFVVTLSELCGTGPATQIFCGAISTRRSARSSGRIAMATATVMGSWNTRHGRRAD